MGEFNQLWDEEHQRDEWSGLCGQLTEEETQTVLLYHTGRKEYF